MARSKNVRVSLTIPEWVVGFYIREAGRRTLESGREVRSADLMVDVLMREAVEFVEGEADKSNDGEGKP